MSNIKKALVNYYTYHPNWCWALIGLCLLVLGFLVYSVSQYDLKIKRGHFETVLGIVLMCSCVPIFFYGYVQNHQFTQKQEAVEAQILHNITNRQNSRYFTVQKTTAVKAVASSDLKYVVRTVKQDLDDNGQTLLNRDIRVRLADFEALAGNKSIRFRVNHQLNKLPMSQVIYFAIKTKKLKRGINAYLVKGKITNQAWPILHSNKFAYHSDLGEAAKNFDQVNLVIIDNVYKKSKPLKMTKVG